MAYTYEHVTLLRVVDGDTIQVAIDVGFRFQTVQTLRLLNLDTPERGEPGFSASRAKLQTLLADQCIHVTTVKQDSFGRWLSSVWTLGGLDISLLMREWIAEQPWATTQKPSLNGKAN